MVKILHKNRVRKVKAMPVEEIREAVEALKAGNSW